MRKRVEKGIWSRENGEVNEWKKGEEGRVWDMNKWEGKGRNKGKRKRDKRIGWKKMRKLII